MLTIFALPKPFRGHIATIQRNAISQWARMSPKPEILLFGNEEGTAEVARELGLRHIPNVKRNQYGTPLLDDVFEQAQTLASYETLCYVNSDIMLLGNFMDAVQRVVSWRDRFLMIGERRNVELDEPAIYESPEQESRLRSLVLKQDRPISPWGIDYFVFPRRLISNFPPFAIGRPLWDNWFLWRARDLNAALVNASGVVFAVHQNHDYSHHPKGHSGAYTGEEAQQNIRLAEGHMRTIKDATHRFTSAGIRANPRCFLAPAGRVARRWYFSILRFTAPMRHALGLRHQNTAARQPE
jgi:hypothetical protein